MTLKRLFCIVFVAILAAGCTNKEDPDKTQEQIDGLKGSKIATVQKQAEAVQASIDVLQAADTEIKAYIKALQDGLDALQGVSEEAYAAALSKINALRNAEADLAARISDLRTYAAQMTGSGNGWIATAFLTFERQNASLLELAAVKLLCPEVENSLGALAASIVQGAASAKAKMLKAVEDAEASVKNWLNKEMAGYYTVAQADAKLQLLESVLAGASGPVAEEVSSLRQELNSAGAALMLEYQKAISNAITANKGVINEKIAAAIQSATDAALSRIEAVSPRLDSLELRIAALEASISGLVGSLESVIVIPEYADGSVTVPESDAAVIRFEVYPLAVAEELAGKGASAFSLDYLEDGATGSIFASIPISDVSFADGVLSVTANCSRLAEEIKDGARDISVRLRISDGKTSCSSDYFRMFYPPKSIFRDDLFEVTVDASGVKSYLLKSGIGDWECSQSNYFNTRSMTNDERFLFFFGSNKNYVSDPQRCGMIIDLKTRRVYKITGCAFSCCPYLDVENDVLYYGTVVNNKTGGEFYRRDLLVDPSVAIKLATLPSYLIPTNKTRPLQLLATHLTLTSDKQKAFLDMHIHDSFVYGMMDLYKGTFDEWGRTSEYQLNHGQINPTNDNMAMMAASSYTSREDGSTVYLQKDPDGLYPRIQIATKTSRYTMVPDITSSRDGGYASHERWDESGQYVYWCSDTPCIRALSEARNMSPNSFTKYSTPSKASHCFFSYDRKLITYDDQSPDYYRSCRWKVQFYNTKTKKEVKIHTLMPALVPKADVTAADGDSDEVKAAKSKLAQSYQNWHTDPHPQFNCNDKYIICTCQRSDKTIRLSITPVDQLLEMSK